MRNKRRIDNEQEEMTDEECGIKKEQDEKIIKTMNHRFPSFNWLT